MSDAPGFYVSLDSSEGGALSLEEVKAFIDESLARHPDLSATGIRASHSIMKVLGERYRDLGVSPQKDWWPGDKVELHFG